MREKQFNQEVLAHSIYLRSVAIKLTSSREMANDLVQDTIYRALLNEDKFLGGNLKAWLATIMRNLFINGIRAAKRRQKVSSGEANGYLQESFSNVVAKNMGDSTIMIKEVEGEINQLHPDLKTPFVMRYHGFKYDEIAQQLNAPIGTIKSRIHLARKQLKNKLGKMYGTIHLSELAA